MESHEKVISIAVAIFLILGIAAVAFLIFLQQDKFVEKLINQHSIPYEVKIPLETSMIAEELYSESLKNGAIFNYNGTQLSSQDQSIIEFKQTLGFKVYCLKSYDAGVYEIKECP